VDGQARPHHYANALIATASLETLMSETECQLFNDATLTEHKRFQNILLTNKC
jgi:hypothetical protein